MTYTRNLNKIDLNIDLFFGSKFNLKRKTIKQIQKETKKYIEKLKKEEAMDELNKIKEYFIENFSDLTDTEIYEIQCKWIMLKELVE